MSQPVSQKSILKVDVDFNVCDYDNCVFRAVILLSASRLNICLETCFPAALRVRSLQMFVGKL